jgi:SpoVK/Ycf46/Vps4 family AAA+-type ATPase
MDFEEGELGLHLSLYTLLAVSALPYVYFYIHKRYWYRADFVKMWDFILSVLAMGLIGGAAFLASQRPESFGGDKAMLLLLHFSPSILTLILLSQNRVGLKQTSGAAKGADAEGAAKPVTSAKNQVERVGWDSLVINQELKEELISVVELLKDHKTAKRYGIDTPKGILLTGPPGTGKTSLARVMASTANLSFFVLKADEVISKWVGDSEKNLSRLFDAATKHAPSLIFIDELDSIGKKRSGEQAWADNLLNHMLQLIDGIIKREGIYIIGATNRPELVDDALKRAGRLNRIIYVPLPDHEARVALFRLYLSRLVIKELIDIDDLARVTEGKSGADIREICNRAGLNAFQRESGSKKREFQVTKQDLEAAMGIQLNWSVPTKLIGSTPSPT